MKNLDRAKRIINKMNAKEFMVSGAIGLMRRLGKEAERLFTESATCKESESREKIQAIEDYLNSEYLGIDTIDMELTGERKEPALKIYKLVTAGISEDKVVFFEPDEGTIQCDKRLNIEEVRMILNKMEEEGYDKI